MTKNWMKSSPYLFRCFDGSGALKGQRILWKIWGHLWTWDLENVADVLQTTPVMLLAVPKLIKRNLSKQIGMPSVELYTKRKKGQKTPWKPVEVGGKTYKTMWFETKRGKVKSFSNDVEFEFWYGLLLLTFYINLSFPVLRHHFQTLCSHSRWKNADHF